MTTEQIILTEIDELPEHLKREVVDFIGFLKSKYKGKKSAISSKRVFGKSKGKYTLSKDFDSPLEDFKEYM